METIKFDKQLNKLIIIDQTKLPGKEEYIELEGAEQVYDAICHLKVRGAPAIGIAAAYGFYIAANKITADSSSVFLTQLKEEKDYLASSRPTARNLFWALERMEECVLKNAGCTVSEIKAELLKEAELIQKEDIDSCKKIGEYSLSLLKPGDGILTHCNAGALATSKYGTATAAMYLGKEKGYNFKVYADETRPLLQGARLTAFELAGAGIDVTLICDNMAASVMSRGWVNAVFVGCDCVAANGDAANKIGTSMLALAAKRYNIPFYVCAPTSTIDLNIKTGKDIMIEERSGIEITDFWYKEPMAPEGVNVFNPAFDVTDNDLITAIVTEKGVIKPGLLDKFISEKHNLNNLK